MKKNNSTELKKINLGCGNNIIRDFVNLDIIKNHGVDVVHDLNKYPYPFKNNQFNYVLLDNVIEHLDDVIKTMEEIHRITKKNGIVEIIVPYFSTTGAFQDPTHKHFFTLNSFNYFLEGFKYNFYSKCRFKIIQNKLIFSPRFKLLELIFNKMKAIYEQFFSYIFPASAVNFKLKVTK